MTLRRSLVRTVLRLHGDGLRARTIAAYLGRPQRLVVKSIAHAPKRHQRRFLSARNFLFYPPIGNSNTLESQVKLITTRPRN